ncbi:N-acetylmuramoyl-L-alanine amidase CwlD [Clostridium sp.]|uniref:N-acetylmuramoyl-L-alanine amidase CwlD n=1 Tax=Clostridium sp. TaxID=1506 RepID=UPI002637D3C4|nr:N-acetylmuramoyl-L-alanine amidase CwlD [Clostridium sp.]
MKKVSKFIITIAMGLLIINPINTYAEENQRIILIDPGHGGFDGGASSKSGTVEKEINLSISLKLKTELEDKGYKVFLTRENDEGLYEKGSTIKEKKRDDLKKRRDMKEEVKCDVFISIHQNMFPQEKCYGSQVWNASNDKSKKLADSIQNSLKETIQDGNKRVSKSAGDSYLILRDTYEGASVLVECGFLSNQAEAERLKTEEHQNLIVKGISLGLDRFFEEINKTSN